MRACLSSVVLLSSSVALGMVLGCGSDSSSEAHSPDAGCDGACGGSAGSGGSTGTGGIGGGSGGTSGAAGTGGGAGAGSSCDGGTCATTHYDSDLYPGFFTYPGYASQASVYSCPDSSSAGYNPLQIDLYVPSLPPGHGAPLLLFFPGTYDDLNLEQLDEPGIGSAIIQRAGELGFAAASLSYYSNDGLVPLVYPDRLDAKSRCAFESDISQGSSSVVTDNAAVAQLCGNMGPLATAATRIDCSKGIVVVGHSQGSAMALMAKNYDSRVAAAYAIAPWAASYDPDASSALYGSYLYCIMADPSVVTAQKGSLGCDLTGFSGMMGSANHRVLTSDHIRAVAGDADPTFIDPGGGAATLDTIVTALNNVLALDCAAASPASCAGSGGAGWFVVGGSQLTPCAPNTACTAVAPGSHAGHCFFSFGNSLACANTSGLTETWDPDPNYFGEGATNAWALDPTLDWLKTQVTP